MTVDDLGEVLDRLADQDYDSNPRSKAELKESFEQLVAHYENEAFLTDDYDSDDFEENFLPLTIGEIKNVYNHLTTQDGGLFVFNDVDES